MPFIAYFFVLVLTAVTAAVSLDYLTSPDIPAPKQEAAKAADGKQANAIRQVPIGRTAAPETTGQATAKADDKADTKTDKALTPIYPAAPGKNLPDAETADADNKPVDNKTADAKSANAADKPQTPPAQTASATPVTQPASNQPVATNPPATPASTQASVPAPAGACAIQACASAYRSFRASDCTYQPYGGARKVCDLSADGARQASAVPPNAMRDGTVGRGRGDDLEDAVRTVRRLPPQADYDVEDDGYDGGAYDRSRIVVIRRDGPRPAYGPRLIYEDR